LAVYFCPKTWLGHFTCPAVGDSPSGEIKSSAQISPDLDSNPESTATSATYKQPAALSRYAPGAARGVLNSGWRVK